MFYVLGFALMSAAPSTIDWSVPLKADDLYKVCFQRAETMPVCRGYIMGVIDGYSLAFKSKCPAIYDRNRTIEDVRSALTRILRRDPNRGSRPAVTTIGEIMQGEFGCR